MSDPRYGITRSEWLLVAVLAVLCVLSWLTSGCAHIEQSCTWEAGHLASQHTESTIVGTGEMEVAANRGCAATSVSTQDTGLSNNGVGAFGAVAEGAARGAVSAVVPWVPAPPKRSGP